MEQGKMSDDEMYIEETEFEKTESEAEAEAEAEERTAPEEETESEKDLKYEEESEYEEEAEENEAKEKRKYGNSISITILNRIGDLLLLHFVFLICSLPIVTLGATLSAAAYVGMKLASGTEGYVFSNFIKGIKDNWKRGSVYFLMIAACSALLVFVYKYWSMLGGAIGALMIMVTVVIAIVLLMIALYVFAVQAKFENTFWATIKNAYFMSVRHLPSTLLMFAIILMIVCLIYNFAVAQWIFAISGFGILAFLFGKIFNRIFSRYI